MAADFFNDPSRRDILRLAGGAAALIALGASPLAALAQTGSGGGPLKIATIGSGREGGALGTLFAKAGHPVMFSSRHPENLKQMVSDLGPLARAGTPAEAAAFGDVLLIAVPYGALPQVGRDLGSALNGKVVLDACNAVAARDGDIANQVRDKGIGVVSASLLPGARVVRAFNTLGARILATEAHRSGEPLAIPIAGDDQAAVQIAAGLVRDAGLEPVVVGGLAKASEFQQGARGYGQQVGARELKQKLDLPQ